MGTVDSHHALLKWLAESIESWCCKFSKLIKKQHPTMSERDLTWPDELRTASNQRHLAQRVMGVSKRWTCFQSTINQPQPSSTPNHGRLERTIRGKIIEEANKTLSQHGLARAWGPAHEEMMPTGSGNLQGQTPDSIATDLA
jgi:hypothetical protein